MWYCDMVIWWIDIMMSFLWVLARCRLEQWRHMAASQSGHFVTQIGFSGIILKQIYDTFFIFFPQEGFVVQIFRFLSFLGRTTLSVNYQNSSIYVVSPYIRDWGTYHNTPPRIIKPTAMVIVGFWRVATMFLRATNFTTWPSVAVARLSVSLGRSLNFVIRRFRRFHPNPDNYGPAFPFERRKTILLQCRS